MPTFTAIAFDRLIEPGAANSMVGRNSPDSKLERRRSTSNTIEVRGMDAPSSVVERGYGIPPNPKLERGVNFHPNPKLDRGVNIPPNSKLERGVSVPPNAKLDRGVSVPPNAKLERGVSVPPNTKLERGVLIPSQANLDRRNGAPTATAVDKENHWTQISPALYATPASTPLPDSPSSFPPSPYIINHKRRGPRLMKSFSEDDVATRKNETGESKVDVEESRAEEGVPSGCKDDISDPKKVLVSTTDNNIEPSGTGDVEEKHLTGVSNGVLGSSKTANALVGQNGVTKSVNFNLQQDDVIGDSDDPQDLVSVKNIGENEGIGGSERSLNYTAAITEFYDAWEELSSESGPHLPYPDIESELREMRLTLLMEVEKRKQAEENLNNLQSQWQRIREQLSLVGLNLPADPTAFGEGEEPADPVADVCQQVYLARFVSNSIGRGMAKAEVEMETEAQIELKNSEIARLWDRLRYYEAVNQEMSQRNQEFVETARRLRQRRKIRRRWIWGSISAAFALGSAALVYSYLRSGKGSSSQSPSQASSADHGSN
ncbi:hypothetical protein C2S53_009822 [Perilla frutescens var. hirtella]|uniref:Uncharacterized protein n=1 Tax=Perilla frutescens var. hirtella TaxID=608512 RepID=A0AAD4PBH8_PERFH|nr:hypothetical protein C2S53_009822 [Perilla frutescens var. hirtella]